jgi:hypothetical protein
MKRTAFSIAMSLLLVAALVPMFAGPVFGQADPEEEADLTTTVLGVVGISMTPSLISYGDILPGDCSSDSAVPDDADRTLTIENIGNCDVTLEAEIINEARTSGEVVDTAPGKIIEGFYKDNMTVADAWTIPTAGSYAGAVDKSLPVPEVYTRPLADDDTAYPVTDVCVPSDYPIGVETGTVVIYATLLSGDDPPTVEVLAPTDGSDVLAGSTLVIQTRNVDDWGVIAETVEVVRDATMAVVFTGPLTQIAGTATDGVWQVEWDTTGEVCDLAGEPYTITVTAEDTTGQMSDPLDPLSSVGVTLTCVDEPPTAVITAPAPMSVITGSVVIDATIDDDVGIDNSMGPYSVGYEIMDMMATPLDPPVLGLMLPVAIDGQGRGTYTGTWDSTAILDGDYLLSVGAVDTSGQSGGTAIPISVDNWTTYNVVVQGGTTQNEICAGDFSLVDYTPEAVAPGQTTFDLLLSLSTLTDGTGDYYETLIPQSSFASAPSYMWVPPLADCTISTIALGGDVTGKLYVSGGDVDVDSDTSDTNPLGLYTFGDAVIDGAGSYLSTTPMDYSLTTYPLGACDSTTCGTTCTPPVPDPPPAPVSELSMLFYDTTATAQNTILAGSTVHCLGALGMTVGMVIPGPLDADHDSLVLTGAPFDDSTTPATMTWAAVFGGLGMGGGGDTDMQAERVWELELTEVP